MSEGSGSSLVDEEWVLGLSCRSQRLKAATAPHCATLQFECCI